MAAMVQKQVGKKLKEKCIPRQQGIKEGIHFSLGFRQRITN